MQELASVHLLFNRNTLHFMMCHAGRHAVCHGLSLLVPHYGLQFSSQLRARIPLMLRALAEQVSSNNPSSSV